MTVQVNQNLGATNSDILSGTQLDQIPGPGTITIWAASTVADSTFSVTLGGQTLMNAQVLPLRANGVPSMLDDIAIVVATPGGSRPILSITEVTAMTVLLIAVFEPSL